MKSRELILHGRRSVISTVCRLRHLGSDFYLTNNAPCSARSLPMNDQSEFVTVERVVDIFKATDADMKSTSAHPAQAVLRVVRAEDLRALRIYEVRQESVQTDLTESPDVAVTAAEERKQAARASRVCAEIRRRLGREKLDAQTLYRLIGQSPRPDITRRLVTRDIANDVIADDGTVVEAGKGPGMIQCASEISHTISIKVAGVPTNDTAHVVIAAHDPVDELMARWFEARCPLNVSDIKSGVTLCCAMLTGTTVRITVSASVQLRADAKCTDVLLLNLMRIEDAPGAMKILRDFSATTLPLFDDSPVSSEVKVGPMAGSSG